MMDPLCQCPFCDDPLEAGWQALALHLTRRHQYTVPSRGYASLRLGTSKRYVMCWCGGWFALGVEPMELLHLPEEDAMGNFAKHLRRRGGPAAHFLELSLLPPKEGQR